MLADLWDRDRIVQKAHGGRGHEAIREIPDYMNYHWRVFRAKGKTAKLTVSDWVSDTEPGGPVGQELMFNFIEVQPYIGN